MEDQKLLIIKKLDKKYHMPNNIKIHVLKNMELEFKKGEFVSILGESGSGKSTLLNILGGLDNDFGGDYFVNNQNTKNYNHEQWDYFRKHKVGFIFQDFNLIPYLTVLENVEFSLTVAGISKIERTQRAKEMLVKVGLEQHMDKKPDFLSGGEQQRVAIARALVKNPEIILADEPTGQLDSQTSIEILELIKKLTKDKLVIMVTHMEEFALKFSSRIIKIDSGKITEDFDLDKEEKESIARNVIEENNENLRTRSRDLFLLSLKNLFYRKRLVSLLLLVMVLGMSAFMLLMGLSTGTKDNMNTLLNDNYDVNRFTIVTYSHNEPLYKDYENQLKKLNSVENVYIETVLYPAFNYQEDSNPSNAFIDGRGITGNLEILTILIDENSSFKSQIVVGNFPHSKDEILISRITALNLIFDFYEKNKLPTDDIMSMNDEDIYNTIKEIDITYFTSHKADRNDRYQVGSKYYQELPHSLKISGIVKDDKFYTSLNEISFDDEYYNPRIYIINDLYNNIINQYHDKSINTDFKDYFKATSLIVELDNNDYHTRLKVIRDILISHNTFNYFQEPVDELYENINSFSIFMMSVGIVFGVIIFIISALITSGMIFKNMEKRKKEFGILFSFGLSRRKLKQSLFYEGLILGTVSMILSISVFYIVKKFMNETVNRILLSLFEIKHAHSINIIIIKWYIILIVFILLLIAYTNPVRKFKKLSIVDVLREE